MVSTHRFRWAELQLAIFLDENSPFRLAEDVISKLDRLDEEVGLPDLDLVYNDIYQKNPRAGTRDRENVMKTFNFLMYSFAEWYLQDLANAISLGVDGRLNLTIDASYVLDICSNFLVVDRSGYVQFAHLSVPEYVKGGRSAIVFSDMDAHAQIAEVCLSYVMSPSAQEIVKNSEFDRRQALGRPLRRRKRGAIDIPPVDLYYDGIGPYYPLGLHMYAFALCLEHCELASMVKRQKGTALCSLFTTFMSVVEINPEFLTWTHPSLDAKIFPAYPPNWTAQKRFGLYRTKREQTLADPQDTFFAACAYGFTEILQDMMRSGANVDVNRRNRNGAPGLWVASRYGQFSVVELLLDEGAEFDIKLNRYDFTPLYEAAIWGHLNIVTLLLSRGAYASARFKWAYNHISEINEQEANLRIAISYKSNETNKTLLHAIARDRWARGEESMDESKMSSTVSTLLEHGASIEAIDDSSKTPLHIACKYNNSLAVSVLLHHNATLGALDRDGRTPLMYSVFTNTPPGVLALLLKKASFVDIVRRDRHGHSVLSHSILSLEINYLNTTMLLLDTVKLRAAQELGTQEGDESVKLSQAFETIGYDVLREECDEFMELARAFATIGYVVFSEEWKMLRRNRSGLESQRSVINSLQAVAEKRDVGELDWEDADIKDKLRKKGIYLWGTAPDSTIEEEKDDTDDASADDDNADDDNDTNSDDDAAGDDNADDDNETDRKNL